MAGPKGDLSKCKNSNWFVADGCNFAVLLVESKFKEFNDRIRDRADITHLFLVTDSEEAFREMKAQVNGKRNVKMLHNGYLDNFKLNTYI